MAPLKPQDEDVPAVIEAFWRTRDAGTRLNINSPDELWEFLDGQLQKLGELDFNYPPRTKDTRQLLYFRGQSNISYGLTTSLYREVQRALRDVTEPSRPPRPIAEIDLARVEQRLISEVRDEGAGRRLTDGQLLMVMQHHGMPTRLLDFSRGPFEALFFAVESGDDQDGALFFIHPHEVNDPIADLHAQDEVPWKPFVRGTRASSAWTTKVAVVNHLSLDPRMHAQDGVFLIGGLARRYGSFHLQDFRNGVGAKLEPELVPQVSNFSINWVTKEVKKTNARTEATGWVVRIDKTWKRELRSRLAAKPHLIHEDTMYPPLAELRRLARREVSNEVRIIENKA